MRSKRNSTKGPRCGTSTRISRLFSVLSLVAGIKLVLVVVLCLGLIPGFPGDQGSLFGGTAMAASKSKSKGKAKEEAKAEAQAPAKDEAKDTAKDAAPPAENPAEASAPASFPKVPGEASAQVPTDQDSLRRQSDDLTRREQALHEMEKEVDAKLARITQLEASIKQLIGDADSRKDEKLRHLIDVYANMKPKQAADALEKLQEDIAVKILAGMKGRQAGEVMSNMRAEKAATLSEALSRLAMPSAASR